VQLRGTTWENNVIYRSNAGAWEHKGGNSVINNYAIDVLPKVGALGVKPMPIITLHRAWRSGLSRQTRPLSN
jgi:hypothetical protein